MAKRTIRNRITKEEAKKLIRNLPAIMSGSKPSQFGLHKIFWGAIAYSMFESIWTAFIIKSLGGTDDLGNSWPDLAQSTKAYKIAANEGGTPANIVRRARVNAKLNKAGERQGLGLLTPGEYKKWKQIFGTIYHNYVSRYGEAEAKQMAGQIAWTRLKEMGAVTKWDVLGTRDLLIMRRSERLGDSLSPGNFDPNVGYRKSGKDQIFILQRGQMVMGTNVEYAEMHNKTRPVWPEEMNEWMDKAVDFAMEKIVERLESILQ